jgi:DNA-binding MarR family transcriptional regulator
MREEDVYLLQKQIKRLYRRVQLEQPGVAGVSYSALQLLVALERAERPLRPGELAGELQMTTSNVAAALRSLEADDLVVRQPDPEDKRKAQVSLTAKGATLITGARHGKHAWLHQAIADLLTPGEQLLLLNTGKLMQRLAESGPGNGTTSG